MRLGLFGGSFDPVHHGHLLAARTLREELALDQVRLIPAGAQPFKEGGHRAAAEDRARMVELAVDGESGLLLDRLEIERPGPSYTVETVRALAARHSGARLTVLIGSDAAAEFGQWKDADGIRALAEVVVFMRGVAERAEEAERAETVLRGHGFRVVEVPLVDISATRIRERVRAGRSIRYLVPERVAEYIAAQRLYRGEDE